MFKIVKHQFDNRKPKKNVLSNDDIVKESEEIRNYKLNFRDKMEFSVYEEFFRTFCYNKDSLNVYELRANLASLNKGVQYWCGGQENKCLAYLIFNYISKGCLNHDITCSEFVNFASIFKCLSNDH